MFTREIVSFLLNSSTFSLSSRTVRKGILRFHGQNPSIISPWKKHRLIFIAFTTSSRFFTSLNILLSQASCVARRGMNEYILVAVCLAETSHLQFFRNKASMSSITSDDTKVSGSSCLTTGSTQMCDISASFVSLRCTIRSDRVCG